MGTPSHQGFQLTQNFFGFKPEDRITLHDNLYNLIWHGEGRWSWDDIYYMPVHIRMHWIRRVNTYLDKKQQLQEQQNSHNSSISKKPKR
jgi:hypothetical protein